MIEKNNRIYFPLATDLYVSLDQEILNEHDKAKLSNRDSIEPLTTKIVIGE
ncbi:hypothetical protein [Acinetobacter sp. WZC-1]|uniref:hypothetical protein n=1 Tax=Acinetobacter sp. WZC-1 TaxID=3459034 RepID=UPI00403DDBA3